MPHTNDALRDDLWAQRFGPPHQAAAFGACAKENPPRCDRPGRDFVAIARSFERARTASETRVVPIANSSGRGKNAAARSVPQLRDAGGRASAVRAMRVLVVEDDAVIGTLLAEMLAGMGHDVCAIEATETDAVIAAARCKPDLMIVDVGLSEGSGISAVETIHRIRPVPHVFVSGDVSRIRALRPGSIFMLKPYRESDLARVIRQAIAAVAVH